MQAVILAVGLGTRLRYAIGEDMQKVMLKLDDKPLLQYAVKNLMQTMDGSTNPLSQCFQHVICSPNVSVASAMGNFYRFAAKLMLSHGSPILYKLNITLI